MDKSAILTFNPDLKNSFGNIFLKTYVTKHLEHTRSDAGHRHDYYSIEFITDGTTAQYINEEKYMCSRGSIVLLSPFDIHRYTYSGVLTMDCLCFNEETLYPDVWENMDIDNFPYVVNLDDEGILAVSSEIKTLQNELARQDNLSESIIKSAVNRLVVQILRCAHKKTEKRKHSDIRQALSYIRYHFREPLTMEDVANYLHITPSYFCRRFKAYTKQTFKEYVTALRLEYALRQIKTTDKSITEICFESGFATSAYFSKVFTQAFGINPSQVRNKHAI